MAEQEAELNLEELRQGGILKQRQKDYFILRTRIPGGYLKAETLAKVSEIAAKYGKGYVHLSTRQCIEISWIKTKDIPSLLADLERYGILKGACGPRSRNVVACPGRSVCRFGFSDTQDLAIRLDERFFGLSVPKKFKIAVSGCPNSCAKPQENDVGFMAEAEPELDIDACIKCGLCAQVCEKVCKRPAKAAAITLNKDKLPEYDKKLCFFEGDCIRACPTQAWKVKRSGYAVFLGGKIGRFPMLGYKAGEFLTDEQVIDVTAKAIEVYNKIADKGERFGEAINKLGIDKVREQIL